MTGLLAEPQSISTAAGNATEIRSAIGAAKAAAAGPTIGVAAAAADEVSAAAAKLFASYAQEYQALLNQASIFHEDFAEALASAGNAYAAAEAANASAISGALEALTAPFRSLLGGGGATPALPGGGGSPTPLVVQPSLQGTTFGLVIGGSGEPIPPPSTVTAALDYFNQIFTVLPSNANALFTPEALYPLTGVKSLTFDISVAQGVQILDSAIKSTLAANPTASVAVFGTSQSAVISSLEMENLANP